MEVYNFEGKTASGGVALSMYNTTEVCITVTVTLRMVTNNEVIVFAVNHWFRVLLLRVLAEQEMATLFEYQKHYS